MKLFLFLCLTLVLFIASSQFSSSTVRVKIFSPPDLVDQFKKKNVSLTVANYGYVPYGKSLIGNLHLANPRNACSPLAPFMARNNHTDPSPIVVIERGGCHFVTKSHYAQLIGAKMALLIDDRDENENFVLMVDDGFGNEINIPTIMISKLDGQKILKYLEDPNESVNSSVALSFHFDMPKPGDNANLQLLMSAMDTKSYEFIKNFNPYYNLISEFTNFIPHYALWFCPDCKEKNYTNITTNNNCISSGRYCAPDPDGDGPLSGKEVVLEDLRQICLFKMNNKTWWDYEEEFSKKCLKDEKLENIKKCSEPIYLDLGYDKEKVEKCISSSFYEANNIESDNKFLAEERKLFFGEGVFPSVRINSIIYRGNMVPSLGVFDAVCEGLINPPSICDSSDPLGLNTSTSSSSGGTSGWIIFFIIFSLVIFMVIVLFFYKRMIRREMSKELQLQVNTTISQYFALREERKV